MRKTLPLLRLLLACSCFLTGIVAAQNPPYLREMPSVERIMAEIKGKDAGDTTWRQMGAFQQLEKVIEDTAGPRHFRGQYTPDEIRLIQQYAAAYGKLRPTAPRGLNPYDVDPRYLEELFVHFQMNATRAAYAAQNAAYAARHKQFQEQQQQNFEAAKAQAAASQSEMQTKLRNQREAELCLASGRSMLDCAGSKLNTEAGATLGMLSPTLKTAFTTAPGLYLAGTWSGGGWKLVFPADQNFVLVSCGGLRPEAHDYVIENSGNGLQVNLKGNPPLAFTYHASGGLVVRKPVTMSGVVQTGVRHGTRHYGDGHTEPISEPILESRTASCAAGVLPLTAAPSAMGPGSVLSNMPMVKQSEQALNTGAREFHVRPGLRLVGNYANPTGLTADFQRGSAMIACGDTAAAAEYTVSSVNNQLQLKLADPANPYTFAIERDGKLSGPATIKLSGRASAGKQNDQYVFTSKSITCPVGTLTAAAR